MIAGRTQAGGHVIDAFDQMDRTERVFVRVACMFEHHQGGRGGSILQDQHGIIGACPRSHDFKLNMGGVRENGRNRWI
jgi:hypothetical protein